MNDRVEGQSLKKIIMTGFAALALAGAADSIAPAQAMPLVAPSLMAGPTETSVQAVHYMRYRHWHRRGYYGRRPVPCQGPRTHMSKKYC